MTRILALLILFLLSAPAYAAGGGEKPKNQIWPWEGAFGTYDRASLQRGFQVYKQVCSACHGMDRIAYRNLADLGYNEAEIKAIAAEYLITDGPNEEGEMFERPGRPSDTFKNPYPNANAAKAVNNGALPVDLSLIIKARSGGADYLYALLTGYGEAPHGHEVPEGKYWNAYFSGNVIAMPPPLTDGIVTYADGSPETASQYAYDVAQFLKWASDPYLEEQKRTGMKVLLFLVVFAAIMYAAKRKVWSDLH